MRIASCGVIAVAAAVAAGAQEPGVPVRLSLADAFAIAAARSPLVQAARAEVALAQAELVGARERPNPTVSLSSEGWTPGGTGPPGFVNKQELVVKAEQEIETAGRRRLRMATASLTITVAEAVLADRLRDLHLQVARAYCQLVLAAADRRAASTSLEEIDRVLAVSRTRYKLGELSGVELRRLEVERLRFADDVWAADLAEANARSRLLALLGSSRLDQPCEPVDSLAPPPGSPAGPLDVQALRQEALARRADLEALRREQDRAASDLQLQRALRTPTLTAGAGYRREFGDNGLVVELSVPLPLFGRNAGAIAKADAERRLAGSRLAAAETRIALEVQEAVNSVEATRSRLAYLESSFLPNAREARDIVLAAFRSGDANLIDFLDAERALRESQRTYNRALYDHRISLFELDAAVGRTRLDARGITPAGGQQP